MFLERCYVFGMAMVEYLFPTRDPTSSDVFFVLSTPMLLFASVSIMRTFRSGQ